MHVDLGPEFVYEALRTDPVGSAAAQGMTMRFLANVRRLKAISPLLI